MDRLLLLNSNQLNFNRFLRLSASAHSDSNSLAVTNCFTNLLLSIFPRFENLKFLKNIFWVYDYFYSNK